MQIIREQNITRGYSVVSPSLDGILSDDSLYFEGISRPSAYYAFRDAPEEAGIPGDPVILERYWNDVYNLFLRKLSAFASRDEVPHDQNVKLEALLQELIKVKELIVGQTEKSV